MLTQEYLLSESSFLFLLHSKKVLNCRLKGGILAKTH